ncbi:MAG: hypothetical protein IT428_29360 [Planctomycetaceae bacterium]|nr:hypothetical protein [Planctomycetaceae bacterium]
MPIHLTSELEDFLKSQVAAGRFASVDAAACAAVKSYQHRLDANSDLKRKIAEAEAELARNEGIVLESDAEIDDFFDEILNDQKPESNSGSSTLGV